MTESSIAKLAPAAEADAEMQQMLVDSARRWGERACQRDQRALSSSHPVGCRPERWLELAELGWLGISLPEADGGLGAGLPELCLLSEQLGRTLLVEPFVACGVLASGLIDSVAATQVRDDWLPALASGEKRLAWAAWEPDGSPVMDVPSMTATLVGSHWQLTGSKGLMPGVGGADAVMVTARMEGSTDSTVKRAKDQLGLFLVDGQAEGVSVNDQRLYDGRHAATLQLNGASGILLQEGPATELLTLWSAALDRGLLAHCAETLGTAQAAFDLTLDYVRTRRQFGRTLGQNQVLQHRLVDLYVELQEARALCMAAAQSLAPREVSALGLLVSKLARHVWEEAIQLHGAIGMTEEYALGEYIRRLALAADLYGSSADHAERMAQLSLPRALETT